MPVTLSLVALLLAPGLGAQETGDEALDCIHTAESVGGVWLSNVEAFPEDQRDAAARLAEGYGDEAADFMATVDAEGDGFVFHLWHRTVFEPENCNMNGNPGGMSRDVHIALTDDGGWTVTQVLFWQ